MKHLKRIFTLCLALLLCCSVLAEDPTPAPIEYQEFVIATPTAAPVSAEIIDSSIEEDGLLRVLLRSLGAPGELHLKTEGDYAVEGATAPRRSIWSSTSAG